MLLARSELKDIVIPCRHTVLSLSNLPQYYMRLQSRRCRRRRHPRRRRRREIDSAVRARRNVDQQMSEPGDLYARSELIALPMSD